MRRELKSLAKQKKTFGQSIFNIIPYINLTLGVILLPQGNIIDILDVILSHSILFIL